MHSRNHGFSLVELLIVMALVTCAYAFMFGPGTAWSQGRAKTRCAQQLQQMHAALALFAAEHDGNFPAPAAARTSEPALSLLVPLYTTDTSIFICPGSGQSGLPGAQPFADRRCSYAYVAGLKSNAAADQPLASDAQLGAEAKVAGEPLFSSTGKAPGNNHRGFGGSVLYVDGHVEVQDEPLARRDFALPPGARLLNPKP
jgi:prepilin-type N-terminal cleavage/methylation domain-containing protein/prepilin-type processing-associated H-X9-DG protein